MTASTFDTLAAADELRDAGLDDKQVRAIIDVHRRAGEPLATKAELKALEGRLYRALWIQGTGIVLVIGTFIAVAAALRPL